MSKLKTWENMFYYHQFLGILLFFRDFSWHCLLSQIVSWLYVFHGVCQWDLGERVCLPRFLLSGWATAAALCCLPARLPVHPGHQCHHHLHHCAGQSPPHPHVLLPYCPLLFWNLLYLRHYTQDAGWPAGPKEDHLLSGLCYADVFLPLSRLLSLLPAGSHGLWSLRGHLWPSALHTAHGAWGVLGTSGCCLCLRLYCRTDHHILGISPALSLLQPTTPLLLWHLSCPQAGIASLLPQSVGRFCAWCICLDYSPVTYPGLLHPHHLCHSKNPIICWKIQNLLYMCLSSHCDNCSLWLCLFHLLKAQIQLLNKSRHPNICVLYHPHTTVQPNDLQPEK